MFYEATHNMKLKEILHELHGISARFWHYWVFSQQEFDLVFPFILVILSAANWQPILQDLFESL